MNKGLSLRSSLLGSNLCAQNFIDRKWHRLKGKRWPKNSLKT